jgi:hypothetical protein
MLAATNRWYTLHGPLGRIDIHAGLDHCTDFKAQHVSVGHLVELQGS